IRYDLPPRRLPHGEDFLNIVRLPEIVPGGAINAPFRGEHGEDWSSPSVFAERQGSMELGKAWLPGAYEVRIYDRYPGAIAYARIGFTVANRDLPPLPDGFVRGTEFSDWPRDDMPPA